MVSANVLLGAGIQWNNAKQGCLNRTYDSTYSSYTAAGDLPSGTGVNQSQNSGTIINNPRRKVHLTSGIEWIVAAYGTPDRGLQDYCNIDSRGIPAAPNAIGTNSNINCISKFGARNMIGNANEWTDEWVKNGKLGGINKWSGTVAEGMSATAPAASGNMAWSFRAATLLSAAASVSINGDGFTSLAENAGTSSVFIEGGLSNFVEGRGWTPLRGGATNTGAAGGRFYLNFNSSPAQSTAIATTGARCALLAPQPTPRVARLASESDATTTKLSWVTLDTEDSTTIKLASAADKATLDTFDGTNTSAGVAINTIALDATTGKHIGAGGCEGTYTPKAAGFESEVNNSTRQDTYYSGKYCAVASGTKYYKLCATNPSIAQVTDDYTAVQRTSCSAVVAVIASQALPAFSAYSNAAKLQNDSDGPFARFYFNASGGTNVTTKLVYGVNIDQVKRYNGDSAGFSGFDPGTITSGVYYGTLSGIKTIDIPAGNTRPTGGTVDCDTAEYDPVATTWGVYQPFTAANGVTATHFACVNMSAYPKFTKMFFKVIMANTDGAGNITSGWVQSEVRGAGYVPTGMVYVTREEWQSIKNGGEDYTSWAVCVGAASTYPTFNHIKYAMPGVTGYNHGALGCVYDYAMDKYEAYNSNAGTLNTGTFNNTNLLATDYNTSLSNASPATPASVMTGNTSTAILSSAKAKTAAVSGNWFAFKKGCDNRTAQIVSQGFLASNASPTNNVRLPTGQEWTVAAYNTPDDGNANTTCTAASTNSTQTSVAQGGAFAGTGGMPKCVSTFGSYDHIGNVWEWTDEVTLNGAHAASSNFYHLIGTTHNTAFATSTINNLILSGTVDGWVSTWDYLTGFPSATTGSGTSYYYWLATSIVGPPAGGNSGANWVASRGGHWSSGSIAGRFALSFNNSPSYWGASIGARCSLAVP